MAASQIRISSFEYSLDPCKAIARMIAGGDEAVIWPANSLEIPDDAPPHFRMIYLEPGFARMAEDRLLVALDSLHRLRGQTRREFRNAIAFAVMDRELCDGIDGEMRKLKRAYRRVYWPRPAETTWGGTRFDLADIALDENSDEPLHAALMSAVASEFRTSLSAAEVAELIGLGRRDRSGIFRAVFPLTEIAGWFFRFMHFPRLRNLEPLYAALAEGIQTGKFGIVRSPRLLRLDTSIASIRKDLKSGESAMAALNFERGFYLVDLRAQGSK